MIPEDVVAEVRLRADIVEMIGEHVPLKRAGKDFKALCPFHREKTPSFYVVPAKGFYKCFGCGESGDVFSFFIDHLGLDFQEAVRHLAGRVGVEIPEPGRRREDDPNRRLYEAVAFAADFYRRRIEDESDGAAARDYLERRGIGGEAAERFQLGYAPDAWRVLREAAHAHGISDDVLMDAGLIKTSERVDEPYDRLRGRLVFPITDARGRIVAFGGRLLDAAPDGAPKYLNSPETPIYRKSEVLYGLHWARRAIRRAEAVLVVEGYMDYVSLAANGVEHVAAPLGTAMTTEQAELLARYTKQALLLYDSDKAGLRATFRSGDALLRAGIHPMVVSLPEGEDPDSVVRAGGGETLGPYLDSAVDVLDRKLQILDERGYFQDVEKIRKALDGLLPTLRAAADPALRDIYVVRVAERTGVRRETIERELAEAPEPPTAARTRRPRKEPARAPARRRRRAPPGLASERKLVLLLLRDEERIADAAEELESGDFGDAAYRELFEALVRSGGIGDGDPSALDLGPEARRRLEELRGDPEELYDADRIFRDVVNTMRARRMETPRGAIQKKIRAAQEAGDEERLKELVLELKEMVDDSHSSLPSGYSLGRVIRRHGLPERSEPPDT